MTAFAGTAFATTVRVIHRVHGHATNGWADTHPAFDTGLAQLAQAVFFVGDFTNRCTALDVDLANLTGPHTHLSVNAFASQQSGRSTCRASNLRSSTGLQLDAMGGHKHHYRVVDFKRNKDAIPAKVERIEYDPNRTAHIALLCYADGERRYIIAPRGIEAGATLLSGAEAPIRAGNTLPIRNIPVGSTIHCIELKPGAGAQIARSAGASATLLAREGIYAQVRMRSGEVRKIHIECRATIGEVANEEHSLRQLGKAGVKRWMGIRPTVRGVAMNPVDHPHGGGEGRTGEGRHAVDPWGNLTKGYRTRNNKRTQVMIVSRRKK